MALPLHERAVEGRSPALVRLTEHGLAIGGGLAGNSDLAIDGVEVRTSTLLPGRELAPGEQYRFHFDMTKCIGCRSCEVACNEQNGNPAGILWRRIGELEGGSYPDTQRHYLSMGCNHCLDADCLRGCPVDAYTKDPVTGIVVHSAEACIGCSYCVWNCPYSVPQFNPERGVVGKCDMCKGRLEDSLEPACVNACPEGAIEIEIVNRAEWRQNFAAADSPGMPPAMQTISTTRITLPENAGAVLARVDAGQIQPEHAHLPLVYMTALMQAVAGAVCLLLLWRGLDAVRLGILLGITALALTLSTLHLGRPAYAWRALKMWRRSWLSREVLLFTLFFAALAAATCATAAAELGFYLNPSLIFACDLAAAVLGVLGTLASAAIYLVQARPAWNLCHTPIDFVLTAGLLGSLLAAALEETTRLLPTPRILHLAPRLAAQLAAHLAPHLARHLAPHLAAHPAAHLAAHLAPDSAYTHRLGAAFLTVALVLWLLNQGIRAWRLERSTEFEAHASFILLASATFSRNRAAALLLIAASVGCMLSGHVLFALLSGLCAVLIARHLFFVSVVPRNMALTFVRSRHA